MIIVGYLSMDDCSSSETTIVLLVTDHDLIFLTEDGRTTSRSFNEKTRASIVLNNWIETKNLKRL